MHSNEINKNLSSLGMITRQIRRQQGSTKLIKIYNMASKKETKFNKAKNQSKDHK